MQRQTLLPWILISSLIGACIEIDLSVPGFPEMATTFHASAADIKWTLTINFIGFCVACLLFGPLSDSYGRRKTILLGFGLFTLGGLGCVYTHELSIFYISRFFQGFGASCIWVVAFAIIADVYQGAAASRFIGTMNSILTAAMALAPVLGSFICDKLGWRATYSTIAILSLSSLIATAAFLPETNNNKKPFHLRSTLKDYLFLLSSKDFLGYALAPSVLVAGYLAYVTSASFLYVNELGMSLKTYAIHQAYVIGSFSVSSFYTGKIEQKLGTIKCLIFSIFLCLIGITCIVTFSRILPYSAIGFSASMATLSVGIALCFGVIFTASMELYPDLKGPSSSLIMGLRVILCALGAWLSSVYYSGQLYTTAKLIAIIDIVGVILVTYIVFHMIKLKTLNYQEQTIN